MQRMITPVTPLPPCRANHTARLIHDCRRASAGGGMFIECACSATGRHAEFVDALREWKAMHYAPLRVTYRAPVRRAQQWP